jgi:hypothetical protein
MVTATMIHRIASGEVLNVEDAGERASASGVDDLPFIRVILRESRVEVPQDHIQRNDPTC